MAKSEQSKKAAAPAKKMSSPPPPKMTKKVEAESAAAKVDDVNALKEAIVKEMCLVTVGKRVDIQAAMAYCRQLLKRKPEMAQ